MTFIWPSDVSLFKAFSWTLSIHCAWISALYFATSPQEVGPAPGTQRAPAASVACRRRSETVLPSHPGLRRRAARDLAQTALLYGCTRSIGTVNGLPFSRCAKSKKDKRGRG